MQQSVLKKRQNNKYGQVSGSNYCLEVLKAYCQKKEDHQNQASGCNNKENTSYVIQKAMAPGHKGCWTYF